ncbi:MAG: glycosyltransferase, partial [Casimicrobiaceae bacterium]
PSEYIGALVRQHFPGIVIECVAPGIGRAANAATVTLPGIAADFHAGVRRTRIGIIGAIGPHKGSNDLAALGHALAASDASLVVIGYTDSRIERGWVTPHALYVHGAYEEHQLPALLDAYGIGIVLFPNRLPESFSYTLSEAWAAGRPVIVPAAGALGERVGHFGGGWMLDTGYCASDVATLVGRVTALAGAGEWAQVKSEIDTQDPLRIPPLATMTEAFDALYARFAQPADGAEGDSAADALTPLVAANLDGRMFRRELVRATGELDGAHAWSTKLATDVAELKAAVERLECDNRTLADVRAAFVQMPRLLQRYLLKRAFRDRR